MIKKQEDNIMDGQITTEDNSLAVIQEPAAELIRVTQLPIIEERLRSMKQAVEAATAQAMRTKSWLSLSAASTPPAPLLP